MTDLKRLKERKEALLRSKGYLNNEENQQHQPGFNLDAGPIPSAKSHQVSQSTAELRQQLRFAAGVDTES